MTSRSNVLAALLLVALAVWSLPGRLDAQVINCPCNHFTVRVDPAVACPVTVCYETTMGSPIVCNTVAPGGTSTVPCPVYGAGVRLCTGVLFYIFRNSPLPDIGSCTRVLTVTPGCCVRVCRVRNDAAGCPVFDIQPAPCPSAGC